MLDCHPDSRGERRPQESTTLVWGMEAASCLCSFFVPVAKPRNPAAGCMEQGKDEG